MKSIFLGFVFISLNFSITLGSMKIGLIPSFVGYYLLAQGMRELAQKSNTLGRNVAFSNVLMVISLISYIMDIFGASVNLGFLSTGIGIVMTIVKIYFEYQVITGLFEVESYHNASFGVANCKSKWVIATVVVLLQLVIIWISVLNLVGTIVAFVVEIVFLIELNNVKNSYYQYEVMN